MEGIILSFQTFKQAYGFFFQIANSYGKYINKFLPSLKILVAKRLYQITLLDPLIYVTFLNDVRNNSESIQKILSFSFVGYLYYNLHQLILKLSSA